MHRSPLQAYHAIGVARRIKKTEAYATVALALAVVFSPADHVAGGDANWNCMSSSLCTQDRSQNISYNGLNKSGYSLLPL